MRPTVSDSSNERLVSADDRLAQHIERIVHEAPPLTPAQLDRLAVLLRGAAS